MKAKTIKLLTIFTLCISFIGTSTALAVSVAGGTWNYGVGYTGTYGYSNYHHPSRSHTASVRNGQTGVINSQRAAAGNWARASVTKIPPTGLEYYYGF